MLTVIAILLAAILVTLLGAWNIVFGGIALIVALIVIGNTIGFSGVMWLLGIGVVLFIAAMIYAGHFWNPEDPKSWK